MFEGVYRDKRVFLTGHTGFKGSWLALWLESLGARVTGFSLSVPTRPNHFEGLRPGVEDLRGDIRDLSQLTDAMETLRPDIVFHLAAQPLVRRSYAEPVETFSANIMGTVHLFEVCRRVPGVRALIMITSDKCYRNQEWCWGYRECDPLGGSDPYSCSKACAELVTECYRASFFSGVGVAGTDPMLVASARAGNVIGGGDWAEDRLIPDMVRAASEGKPVSIRNPDAVRPWQHVLDPLSGYLRLGQKLLEGGRRFGGAYNFGPDGEVDLRVGEMAQRIAALWDRVSINPHRSERQPPETRILRLDAAKARRDLGWRPVWDTRRAIEKTIEWYRAFYEKGAVISEQQLEAYIRDARHLGLEWAKRGPG